MPSRNHGASTTSATTISGRPQVIKLLRKNENAASVLPSRVDKIQTFEEFGDSGKVQTLSRMNTFQPHEVTQIEEFREEKQL